MFTIEVTKRQTSEVEHLNLQGTVDSLRSFGDIDYIQDVRLNFGGSRQIQAVSMNGTNNNGERVSVKMKRQRTRMPRD